MNSISTQDITNKLIAAKRSTSKTLTVRPILVGEPKLKDKRTFIIENWKDEPIYVVNGKRFEDVDDAVKGFNQ